MSNQIKPGKFIGKVVDYGFRKTSGGVVEPQIRFKWKDEFNTEFEWNWRGSLKEGKAREITLAAIVTCGFNGDDLSVMADGVPSGALDTKKEVLLTVVLEPGNDGKLYPKINWINEVGGGGFKDIISRGEVAAQLAGMNLKGDLMALKKTNTTEIPF
jgi:hypothetical protein